MLKYIISNVLLATIFISTSCFAEEFAPGLANCVDNAQSTPEILECLSKAHDHLMQQMNDSLVSAQAMCSELTDKDQCMKKIDIAHKSWHQYDNTMSDAIYNDMERGTISKVNTMYFRIKAAKLHTETLGTLYYE